MVRPEPLLVFDGWLPAPPGGSIAVLPWRGAWLAAQAAGVTAVADAAALPPGVWTQAAVVLQKTRESTVTSLAAAWARLAPGGRLLLVGGNEVGIASAVRSLGGQVAQVPELLANRARARVAAFIKTNSVGPVPPAEASITHPALPVPLRSPAGTFAAGRVDPGSALLARCLEGIESPPASILDLAAGTGLLGTVAAQRWPLARLTAAEGDHRAVEALRKNLLALGLAGRSSAAWWDAAEPAPVAAELVLCNPPCHRDAGKAVDLGPARSIFRQLPRCCTGQALIVANRQLPYERELASVGVCECVAQEQGFKVLRWRR